MSTHEMKMIDKKWIGHELPPFTLELERGRLRAFALAIGEDDPVYTNVEAARDAGFKDLPAPPTFLFGLSLESGSLMQLVEQMGIPLAKLLHGSQGFTYHRVACAGETLSVKSRIADVYEKKGGALQFVVACAEARDQSGQLVVELRTTLLGKN